jgi:hypothetical protein
MAAMKIHHLNCGSVRKIDAPGLPPAHAVNHCLLAETDHDGLVLVGATACAGVPQSL